MAVDNRKVPNQQLTEEEKNYYQNICAIKYERLEIFWYQNYIYIYIYIYIYSIEPFVKNNSVKSCLPVNKKKL